MDKTVHNTTVGQGVGYLSAQPETVDPSLMVLLRGLPLERRTRVVDVGANPNVADAPYLAMTQQGLCDVLGFEPHPGAFAELQKIKGPREHYLPFAVGDGSAKELKVYKSHGFTSIFEPAEAAIKLLALKPWSDIKARIAFDTVRLDDSADVDRFDLLKIDIQGGEGDVFTGAAAKLQTACMVIVELRYFALYKGEPMLSGIDTQLRRLGFQLHKIFAPVSRPLINSQINRLNIKRNPDQGACNKIHHGGNHGLETGCQSLRRFALSRTSWLSDLYPAPHWWVGHGYLHYPAHPCFICRRQVWRGIKRYL